jgi:hypothetical protein
MRVMGGNDFHFAYMMMNMVMKMINEMMLMMVDMV